MSGNPSGGVKPQSLTAELRCQLLEGDTLKQVVASLIEKAKAGDTRAQILIWERCEGDVKRSFELSMKLQNRDYDRMSNADLLELLEYHQKRLEEQGQAVTE